MPLRRIAAQAAAPFRSPHKPDAVGLILVIFGAAYVLYAVSLTGDRPTERTRQGLVVALNLLPMSVWAVLWAVAGVVAISSACFLGARPGPVGFTAAWLPPMGWAVWYFLGVVVADANPRGLVSSGIFAVFALLAFACARVVDPRTNAS